MRQTGIPNGEERELVRRIEGLEAANRRLRGAGALVAAGVLAAVALGARAGPGPALLEADEFRLVDDDGRLRASLAVVDRRPQLRFFRDGRAVLRVGPEQIALGGGEPGVPRLVLAPSGFRGSSRWTEEDTDRPDAQASLWIPADDLSHGPLLSLSHVERGSLGVGWGIHGELVLRLDDRRMYFDRDGYVRWEAADP